MNGLFRACLWRHPKPALAVDRRRHKTPICHSATYRTGGKLPRPYTDRILAENPYGVTYGVTYDTAAATACYTHCTTTAMQESLRLLYVGCTRARDKLIFVHRLGKYSWLNGLPATFQLQNQSGPSHFPSGAKPENYQNIGNAVHANLAALPSLRASDEAGRATVAELCLASFSMTGLLTASVLVSSGERFRDWVDAEFPDARWLTEVPVTVSRAAGGHWNGAVDLLLELPDGRIVIIDHKSAPLRRESCAAKAATFGSQLDAYREMLESSGSKVASCWIHFPLAGVVARQG